MGDQNLYDTTSDLEKQGINDDYIQGWQEGFLANIKREEQRLNEAYEAGYTDGEAKTTDNAANWKA